MSEKGREITLNLALGRMKTLINRHQELIGLRDNNARRVIRTGTGKDAEKEISEPTYDAKMLDSKISRLAKEIRLLDEAIKFTNQITIVAGYLWDDEVLSEII